MFRCGTLVEPDNELPRAKNELRQAEAAATGASRNALADRLLVERDERARWERHQRALA
jgi:hypothetical protein